MSEILLPGTTGLLIFGFEFSRAMRDDQTERHWERWVDRFLWTAVFVVLMWGAIWPS